MKQFFNKLISDNNGVSSKRFLSLFFALIFSVVVVVSLCGVVVSNAIIWSLVTLIGVPAAGATIDKFKNYGKE